MRFSISQAATSMIRSSLEQGFARDSIDSYIRQLLRREVAPKGTGEYPNSNHLLWRYLDSASFQTHATDLAKAYRVHPDRAKKHLAESFVALVSQAPRDTRVSDKQLRDLHVAAYGTDPGQLDQATRDRLAKKFRVQLLATHPITTRKRIFQRTAPKPAIMLHS